MWWYIVYLPRFSKLSPAINYRAQLTIGWLSTKRLSKNPIIFMSPLRKQSCRIKQEIDNSRIFDHTNNKLQIMQKFFWEFRILSKLSAKLPEGCEYGQVVQSIHISTCTDNWSEEAYNIFWLAWLDMAAACLAPTLNSK